MAYIFSAFLDPCTNVKCRYQGEICVTDSRNKPRCVCQPKCPPATSSQLVCGSDGITYSSVCELHRTACSLGVTIQPKYRGRCGRGGEPSKFVIKCHNDHTRSCSSYFGHSFRCPRHRTRRTSIVVFQS